MPAWMSGLAKFSTFFPFPFKFPLWFRAAYKADCGVIFGTPRSGISFSTFFKDCSDRHSQAIYHSSWIELTVVPLNVRTTRVSGCSKIFFLYLGFTYVPTQHYLYQICPRPGSHLLDTRNDLAYTRFRKANNIWVHSHPELFHKFWNRLWYLR